MNKPHYKIVMGSATLEKVARYRQDLLSGQAAPGTLLLRQLATTRIHTNRQLIELLLATKQPQIFAESHMRGDGSDWTFRELDILGDIGVAMQASIYDNGVWSPSAQDFKLHQPPLEGHLLFTPGALLQDNCPDLGEVMDAQGGIDAIKYNALVERRLWPLLSYANDSAGKAGEKALVVMPGIGCGAFAGDYRGHMGSMLNAALKAMLEKHAQDMSHIAGVYFDPFNECAEEDAQFGAVKYRVRPSALFPGRPQLSHPSVFGDKGDDFSRCRLYKMVAWDHASLPGNDFYIMSRQTDDGVTAAATDAIRTVTGVTGAYSRGGYMPPVHHTTWEDVARANNTRLHISHDNLFLPPEEKRQPGAYSEPDLQNATREQMKALYDARRAKNPFAP